MIVEIANNKNKNPWLVGSGDTKPRLKWTPELHHRFVDAVSQLGGAEKATPKSLMRKMNIQGITLYHLKSHLQKFRLGKGQNLQPHQDSKQEDDIEPQSHSPADNSDEAQGQMNESTETAQALRIQMEVHRKLQEQIEVQRHIQQRIEAQGKYLQSVIKMAHETLSGCGSSSAEVELAKAEISKLKLMVDMECFSCSSSALTEKECSVRTDTESLGMMEYNQEVMEEAGKQMPENSSVELPLMEMHPTHGNRLNNGHASGTKRSQCTISDNNCDEKPCDRIFKASTCDQNVKTVKNLDLNKKCLRDFDTCHPKDIDLNCNALERFNGYI